MEQKQVENFTRFVLTLYYRMQEHPIVPSDIRLSSHAFHVLFILNENRDRKVPMTELVTRIRRTKQQLSKIISDLEDSGLVARVRTSENRRTVYVVLTEKGIDFIEDSSKSMVQSMRQFLSNLPEEKINTLISITNQIEEFTNQEV